MRWETKLLDAQIFSRLFKRHFYEDPHKARHRQNKPSQKNKVITLNGKILVFAF